MKRVLFVLIIVLMLAFVGAESSEECTQKHDECAKACDEKCNQDKYDYCRKYEYSGCALDVFCYCHVCNLYDNKWCLYDGWISMASGPRGTYEACVMACQSKRESGGDVSSCWHDCNDKLNEDMLPVKDNFCEKYCKENDYESGKRVEFYDGVWDTCFCEGDATEENLDEDLFADDEDVDGDGVPNRKDWCPNDEGSAKAYGCPDEDGDGVPDFADKCNDEDGTWDYAGCAKTNLDEFSEAPYKFTDLVKYMVTPKGEKPSSSTKIGTVRNILNKKGVKVMRSGEKKWRPLGIGSEIYEGDMVLTGSESKLKIITFKKDNSKVIVELMPQTKYVAPINSDRYKSQIPIVNIIKGTLKVIYDRATGADDHGRYIRTPTVVAGVRGTEFIVSHDPKTGTDIIEVLEGEVYVEGETEEDLLAGEKLTVVNGELGEVQVISMEEIEAIREEYSNYNLNIPWKWIFLIIILLVLGYIFFIKKKK